MCRETFQAAESQPPLVPCQGLRLLVGEFGQPSERQLANAIRKRNSRLNRNGGQVVEIESLAISFSACSTVSSVIKAGSSWAKAGTAITTAANTIAQRMLHLRARTSERPFGCYKAVDGIARNLQATIQRKQGAVAPSRILTRWCQPTFPASVNGGWLFSGPSGRLILTRSGSAPVPASTGRRLL